MTATETKVDRDALDSSVLTVLTDNSDIMRVLITDLRDVPKGLPFEQQLERIAWGLAFAATNKLNLDRREVVTPVGVAKGQAMHGKYALIPITRAGNGILGPFRQLLPQAFVWHFDATRDEETLQPTVLRSKIPKVIQGVVEEIIVLDVMLATGGSVIACLHEIYAAHPDAWVTVCCVLAAPEGIKMIEETFSPEKYTLDILAAHVDERLNERGYIVPGLGDAGDKLYPVS